MIIYDLKIVYITIIFIPYETQSPMAADLKTALPFSVTFQSLIVTSRHGAKVLLALGGIQEQHSGAGPSLQMLWRLRSLAMKELLKLLVFECSYHKT